MMTDERPAVAPTSGWMTSATCIKLRRQLDRWRAFHGGKQPEKWLMSTRIAGNIVAELKPLLVGDDVEKACATDLSSLFGIPVELVDFFPQGAVLR